MTKLNYKPFSVKLFKMMLKDCEWMMRRERIKGLN